MKMVEKLQKRIQEGKKNNKGFSLVELIIVIAIMAILIGIVGMNVLPQIENARQSKDLQVLNAYLTESVEAVTQNASKCTASKYQLTITSSNITIAIAQDDGTFPTGTDNPTEAGAKAILATFKELSGIEKMPKFESTAGNAIGSIVIALDLETGTTTDADGNTVVKNMAKLTLSPATGKTAADVEKLVDSNGLTSK